jgi:hypothetical protein
MPPLQMVNSNPEGRHSCSFHTFTESGNWRSRRQRALAIPLASVHTFLSGVGGQGAARSSAIPIDSAWSSGSRLWSDVGAVSLILCFKPLTVRSTGRIRARPDEETLAPSFNPLPVAPDCGPTDYLAHSV